MIKFTENYVQKKPIYESILFNVILVLINIVQFLFNLYDI